MSKELLRRKILEARNKIAALAVNPSVESVIDEAEKIILDASAGKDSSAPVALKNSLPSAMTKIGELKSGIRKNTGFLSNFTDLDKIIKGFQPVL